MNEAFSILLNNYETIKIIELLKDYEIDFIKEKNQYILKRWNYFNNHITLYTTNKLLIQGENINKVLDYLKINITEKKSNINNYEFDNNYLYEIGSDETGVGDFFCGVVVCSVRINLEQFNYIINQYKINDSKKINDKYIRLIYKDLMNIVDCYSIQYFDSFKYNEFINKYKNSHVLKTYLHNSALKEVYIKNSLVCLDQFVNSNKYNEYLKILNIEENNIIKIDRLLTKAESKYLSVAIASIIARGYYLDQIENLSNQLNIEIPLGSWNEKIKNTAISIYNKYGKEYLKNICKLDFKVINEIIK